MLEGCWKGIGWSGLVFLSYKILDVPSQSKGFTYLAALKAITCGALTSIQRLAYLQAQQRLSRHKGVLRLTESVKEGRYSEEGGSRCAPSPQVFTTLVQH
jgi:hypothetical protein